MAPAKPTKAIVKAPAKAAEPKWYPADDIPKPKKNLRAKKGKATATLRSSLTPGSVVIMLSGRFRGKRAVFLKQLASGTLLVTGEWACFDSWCVGLRALPATA
jgi:large subunit ribosomal protein L6e